MSDEDALFEAIHILNRIAASAGGYVSLAQRERIDALNEYIEPRASERLAGSLSAMGYKRQGNAWVKHG